MAAFGLYHDIGRAGLHLVNAFEKAAYYETHFPSCGIAGCWTWDLLEAKAATFP